MTRPPATVSVDVDPVDLHLVGYGFRGLAPDPLVYTRAVPRLLELFSSLGVRATFFVVGRDAAAHADAVRAIAAAGHEVASHSLTHPMAFARLPEEGKRRELVESRAGLERAGGGRVVGFRSPNFDFDARSIAPLLDAGYRYDASAYPTPLLLPARLLLALKSRDPAAVRGLRPWPSSWMRRPHRWAAAGRSIQEFPVSVTPRLRFPVYHTARYFMDERRFRSLLDGFARRGEPLSYPLHAVDALGLREDGVDPRLARHPGLGRGLAAKLALLASSIGAIAERFDALPFAARLEPEVGAGA